MLVGVPVLDKARRYYNAVVSFGASPQQMYAKSHLVPFGEFVPTGFGWLVAMMRIPLGEFARGAADQQPLAVAGQRVAVNICYEDAFGEEIIRQLPAATLLVNVSNVAWFGDSLAPAQHLRISRMRAVETGRYMLRATNTGVTAIVAPDGAVVGRLPSFTEGVLEGRVRGRAGATPYAAAGNAPVVLGSPGRSSPPRRPEARQNAVATRTWARAPERGGATKPIRPADRDSGSGNAVPGLPSRAARSTLVTRPGAAPYPSTFRAKEAAMTDTEIEALREKISSLRTEHHDLDAAICANGRKQDLRGRAVASPQEEKAAVEGSDRLPRAQARRADALEPGVSPHPRNPARRGSRRAFRASPMGTTIELTASDGHRFAAYRAEPAGKPRGALVVIQEIFGVNSHIRGVADGYAADGYLAIAPALFDRSERGLDIGYSQPEIERGRAIMQKVPIDDALKDVAAAIKAVAAAGKIGIVGYCWGGTVSLAAAAKLDGLACAVSYYGGGVAANARRSRRCR